MAAHSPPGSPPSPAFLQHHHGALHAAGSLLILKPPYCPTVHSVPAPKLVSKVEHQPMKFNQRKGKQGTSMPIILMLQAHAAVNMPSSVTACYQSRLCRSQKCWRKRKSCGKQAGMPSPKLLIYTTPQLQGRIFFFFLLENIETLCLFRFSEFRTNNMGRLQKT